MTYDTCKYRTAAEIVMMAKVDAGLDQFWTTTRACCGEKEMT